MSEAKIFDAKDFGGRLRDAIEWRGLSLDDAARILGIPQPRISEYVNGTRTPRVAKLLEMVATLGLDIRIIFPDQGMRDYCTMMGRVDMTT